MCGARPSGPQRWPAGKTPDTGRSFSSVRHGCGQDGHAPGFGQPTLETNSIFAGVRRCSARLGSAGTARAHSECNSPNQTLRRTEPMALRTARPLRQMRRAAAPSRPSPRRWRAVHGPAAGRKLSWKFSMSRPFERRSTELLTLWLFVPWWWIQASSWFQRASLRWRSKLPTPVGAWLNGADVRHARRQRNLSEPAR